jgi:hypothetical protein
VIYFHDISHQQAFEKDGYTLVNLLSEEEVQALRALYFSNKEAHLLVKDKMHSTSDTHNTDLILAVDAAIKDIVLPKAAKVLKEFDVLLGGFLVKEAGMGSETGFHQDPTLVDDPKYVSANIWISLQDTNFQNGNLQLVKGSHRMVDCLVVTPQFPVFYDSFRSILPQYATNVPVKAGQAIVLNNKLIHGASANQTDVERLAVVMAIKSKAAAWTFHYLEPGKDFTEIEKYAIDLQAFASLEKNQRPKNGTFLGKMHFSFPQISETAFLKFMHANYGTESIWNRLKRKVVQWKG